MRCRTATIPIFHTMCERILQFIRSSLALDDDFSTIWCGNIVECPVLAAILSIVVNVMTYICMICFVISVIMLTSRSGAARLV